MRSFVAGILIASVFSACGGERGEGGDARAREGMSGVQLTGAGATFPFPLYSRWVRDYGNSTGVRINYQSLGSGAGIRQIAEQTVDFGATDSPMTDQELAQARGGEILHIPTVLGAVAVSYNVAGPQQPLRMSGDVIADIFLGRITRWNDARLVALNAGAALPAQDIVPVHRSDGSGTTFVFSDYLTTVSPAWASGPGRGKELHWPVGLGGKGNEGVAGQLRQTPGSIGYVEVVFANQLGLSVAHVQNAAGQFVPPTPETITAAAEGFAEAMPEDTDFRISIVNAPGDNAYPISSFTWILLYREQPDETKGRHLVDFLRWAVTDGQESAAALDYGPLPERVRELVLRRLETVRIGQAG